MLRMTQLADVFGLTGLAKNGKHNVRTESAYAVGTMAVMVLEKDDFLDLMKKKIVNKKVGLVVERRTKELLAEQAGRK